MWTWIWLDNLENDKKKAIVKLRQKKNDRLIKWFACLPDSSLIENLLEYCQNVQIYIAEWSSICSFWSHYNWKISELELSFKQMLQNVIKTMRNMQIIAANNNAFLLCYIVCFECYYFEETIVRHDHSVKFDSSVNSSWLFF